MSIKSTVSSASRPLFDKSLQKTGKGVSQLAPFLLAKVVFLNFQCVKGALSRCYGVFFVFQKNMILIICSFSLPSLIFTSSVSPLLSSPLLSSPLLSSPLFSSLLFSSPPLRGLPLSLLWSFLLCLVLLSCFFSVLCHCFCCSCVVAAASAVAARVAVVADVLLLCCCWSPSLLVLRMGLACS